LTLQVSGLIPTLDIISQIAQLPNLLRQYSIDSDEGFIYIYQIGRELRQGSGRVNYRPKRLGGVQQIIDYAIDTPEARRLLLAVSQR
jgi:hypothetical protein